MAIDSKGKSLKTFVCKNLPATSLDAYYHQTMTTKPRLHQALDLVAEGMTPYFAALEAKCAPSAVYAALKKQRMKREGVCPCCGQVIREIVGKDQKT